MSKINISKIKPVKKLFHNERLDTYFLKLPFNKIHYWPENLRTILAFEQLEYAQKKKLKEISLKEITSFLASRPELKLSQLAGSIAKNGVRVPLIILDDGTLLDGNRRYFSCSYIYHRLKKEDPIPDFIKEIPVWVIKKKEISEIQKQKVLAEANFVPDFKVAWTLDVSAKIISDFYYKSLKSGRTEEDAYSEIENVYGLKKSKVREYVETVELTKEFVEIASGNKKREFKLREQVLAKFVYFWEFRNKTTKGGGSLDGNEILDVKPLFFKMMENSCFKNMKQVEPMIRAYHDEDLWDILIESQGTKIDQVEVLFREQKTIKSSEDKVRNFLKWLNKEDPKIFTRATYSLLDRLVQKIISLKSGEGQQSDLPFK